MGWNSSGENNPNWVGGYLNKECLMCGKKITIARAHFKRGQGRYCSRKCLAKSKWKGQNASYGTIHIWVRKKLGRPKFCEMCGTESSPRFEWADKSGKCLRNLDNWLRLCRSCHNKFDDIINKARKTRLKKNVKNNARYKKTDSNMVGISRQ